MDEEVFGEDAGPIAVLILLFLFIAGCGAYCGSTTQTPYYANIELKPWLKVGDTLVDRDWRSDTLIITALNRDTSYCRWKKLHSLNVGQTEPLGLYDGYINLANPHFKLSKPISYL